MKTHVVAVVGATASGKSEFAVRLCEALGGEVVSCDSMQVYRGMNIGTAKPTAAEMRGVPHHLIDIADPAEPFSVADYVAAAEVAVRDIAARGKLPVFCGGTGLYLDRFLFGGLTAETARDDALRQELFALAEKHGNVFLHTKLCAVDPETAAAVHPNNVRRVVRALEIYRLTGVPKSEWDRRSQAAESRYFAAVVGVDRPRAELVERIDRRVDRMMAEGLLEETADLDARGVFRRNATAAQAIGYKEILPCLRGTCSPEEAADALKLATRQYAKRQLTWFRAKPYVRWVSASALSAADPADLLRALFREE